MEERVKALLCAQGVPLLADDSFDAGLVAKLK